MHRVLLIPEILDNVCGYLPTSAIAEVARCNKQVSTVATRRLWTTVGSTQLASLLNSLLTVKHEKLESQQIFPSDYGHRSTLLLETILELQLDFVFEPLDGGRTLRELLALTTNDNSASPHSVLPNLRKLDAIVGSPEDLHCILPFIRTTLQVLKLRLDPFLQEDPDMWDAVCLMLRELTEKDIDLASLTLEGFPCGESCEVPWQSFLKASTGLTTFEGDWSLVHPNFWMDTTSVLKRLSLTIPFKAYQPDPTMVHTSMRQSLEVPAFRKIRQLRLHGHLDTMTHIFQSLSSTLEDIILSINFDPEEDVYIPSGSSVQDFVHLVDELKAFSNSLFRLSISVVLESVLEDSNQPFGWACFQGLLECSYMEQFDLDYFSTTTGRFLIDDDAIGTIAQSWPCLHSLKLFWPGQDQNVTPACLIPLATHCPNLHTLGLSYVDGARDIPVPPILQHRSCCHAISLIGVSIPQCSHAHDLAVFIFTLWPDIDPSLLPKCDTRTTLIDTMRALRVSQNVSSHSQVETCGDDDKKFSDLTAVLPSEMNELVT